MLIQIANLLLQVLVSIVAGACLLRCYLQWLAFNLGMGQNKTIGSYVLPLSNWIVIPLRRVIPSIGRFDVASFVAAYLLILAKVAVLLWISGVFLPVRVHGAFVSDDEVHRVVEWLKEKGEANYIDGVLEGADESNMDALTGDGGGEADPLYDQAVAIVLENKRPSISLVQRHLRIGYNRAARLLEDMEKAGLVSKMGNGGNREILHRSSE